MVIFHATIAICGTQHKYVDSNISISIPILPYLILPIHSIQLLQLPVLIQYQFCTGQHLVWNGDQFTFDLLDVGGILLPLPYQALGRSHDRNICYTALIPFTMEWEWEYAIVSSFYSQWNGNGGITYAIVSSFHSQWNGNGLPV